MESYEDIVKICSNSAVRANVNWFAKLLVELTEDRTSNFTQTDSISSEQVLEMTEKNSVHEKSYMLVNLWNGIEVEEYKINMIFMFISNMQLAAQSDVFSLLGNLLNQEMYCASKDIEKNAQDITIYDLKAANKVDLYNKCDKRLQSFIDALTARLKSEHENINFKSNIYDNILKARNSKYFSPSGVKEHMVSYLSSGKSMHASQVFSKQGGKGSRPILEKILKNSESVCLFKAPENVTLFFSYDNIQTLLKSHRVGGSHQSKVLAIVVCSILCLLPDGEDKKSLMQYISEFCPANWYSELQFEQKKQIFIEKLNTDTLKSIFGVKQEDLDILEDLFEKELQSAIDYVAKDVDDNLYDSVDVQTRESIRKKVKLCSSGHINENVRSNRTICDRQNCKSNLEEANDVIEKRLEKKPINDDLDQQQKRARKYLNVPNIELEDTPKELAVGAIAVNPNKPDSK